jgi:hypothetical protein
MDHLQGAYGDPCYSYTSAELSVKYVVKNFAVLGQHVFQAIVCIDCRAVCAKLLTMYFTDNSAKV